MSKFEAFMFVDHKGRHIKSLEPFVDFEKGFPQIVESTAEKSQATSQYLGCNIVNAFVQHDGPYQGVKARRLTQESLAMPRQYFAEISASSSDYRLTSAAPPCRIVILEVEEEGIIAEREHGFVASKATAVRFATEDEYQAIRKAALHDMDTFTVLGFAMRFDQKPSVDIYNRLQGTSGCKSYEEFARMYRQGVAEHALNVIAKIVKESTENNTLELTGISQEDHEAIQFCATTFIGSPIAVSSKSLQVAFLMMMELIAQVEPKDVGQL